MAQEEKEDVQQGSSCEGNTEKLQSLEARLNSIKTYLKAESKTEKDAQTLKARLDLTSEERNLTAEEEWYKKNLKAEACPRINRFPAAFLLPQKHLQWKEVLLFHLWRFPVLIFPVFPLFRSDFSLSA